MTFLIADFSFIESLQFMASLLETFNDISSIKTIDIFLGECTFYEQIDMLCKSGCYPHEWVNETSKLDYIGLPPKDLVYSPLSNIIKNG